MAGVLAAHRRHKAPGTPNVPPPSLLRRCDKDTEQSSSSSATEQSSSSSATEQSSSSNSPRLPHAPLLSSPVPRASPVPLCPPPLPHTSPRRIQSTKILS